MNYLWIWVRRKYWKVIPQGIGFLLERDDGDVQYVDYSYHNDFAKALRQVGLLPEIR